MEFERVTTAAPAAAPARAAQRAAEDRSRAFREEGPAILATLIRQVGDFQLAEDALQDAFAAASRPGRATACRERPGAWITTTARRRAIDRLRRERGLADRIERLAELAARDAAARTTTTRSRRAAPSRDDRLRLIFTCCHPALALEARVALTLKSLGGLTTAEVARAFLVSEPTMAQRLVRAKRKIAAAAHPLPRARRPSCCPSACAACCAVVYLDLQRGLRGRRRRPARARRAVRGGDPPRPAARARSCPTTPRRRACWR